MKINIENYLHEIDNYFKGKNQKDTYMTYAMIAALIIAFAYLLFWDSSFNEFNATREKVSSLKSKINTDESFVTTNTEAKIDQLSKEIKNINAQIIENKDNNTYIKSKIETISSLIYDERSWGEYLHSISKNAIKNNIQIINLTNKYAEGNNSFGHVLDITVQLTGNYKDTLQFINSLEQSDLVVDIHDLNITAEKKLKSDLNISVWGISY